MNTTQINYFRLSGAVKIMIALVILFSFGLQMTVSTEVIWSGLLNFTKVKGWYYYVIRSCLICGSGKCYIRKLIRICNKINTLVTILSL